MGLHFSLEQMARLREDVRLLALQAADHERDLHALLASAELVLRAAPADQGAGPAEAVRLARQMCLQAREHQVAIEQVVTDIGADRRPDRPRPPVVLVADDYPEHREWLSILLHDAGFLVRTAANGLEAVIAAHQLRPAVILMDISMPILDGFEATRLIRAIDALRDARVVALSPEPLEHPRFDTTLFTAILPKPSPADQILATVQRCAHPPA
jgi:two-component system, cell cycle response regulator DivK